MADSISSNFGKFLKSIRTKNNRSQAAVAGAAGLSLRHYQEIEYGESKCRIDTLAKILATYDLTIFSFFDSYLIGEFYQHGYSEFKKIIDENSFNYCLCNREGLIIEVCANVERMTEYAPKDVLHKMYAWDMVASKAEKVFARALIPILHATRISPFPWTGTILTKSGKPIRVRGYWRYCCSPSGDVTGFELLTFPF